MDIAVPNDWCVAEKENEKTDKYQEQNMLSDLHFLFKVMGLTEIKLKTG